jgi:16S rRNA C1402 N4-methylase RsmH
MPIEDDFKTKIVKFYFNNEKPTEWAKELSEIIKNEYSQTNINKYLNEATKEFI